MSHAILLLFFFFFRGSKEQEEKLALCFAWPKSNSLHLKGFIILMIKLPGDRQIKATSWEA